LGFSPGNLIAATSLYTPGVRNHHLIQINKKTGLYYDDKVRKINVQAKGYADSASYFGVIYRS
jgi:hypothetical protein